MLDFPELIERAVDLLRQMDEFSQSRYRLESRYHHVLVDEFQDTSRRQWELVALLVRSWGEGFGLVHDAPLLPSLFIVGDRKQSIYRFRDAKVALLDEAARDDRRAAARADGAPLHLAQLPRAAGAARVRQRRLRRARRSRRRRRVRDASRRFPLRTGTITSRSSWRRRSRAAGSPVARHPRHAARR